MRVLVTGSSGFIGRYLVPRLLDEGDEVFVLAREGASEKRPGAVPVPAPADLAAIDKTAEWPEGIEAVIHLAARNPDRRTRMSVSEATLMRANAEGTAALARLSAARGVSRFLFLSSAKIHGAHSERPVVEEDEPAPADAYARSKLRAEEMVRAELAGTATRFTILRPAPVFGAGARGGIAALARLAASHLPLPFANLHSRRSVLSVDNLVDALLLVRGHPAAGDETFLLADEEPPTVAELVEMMRGGQSRRPGLFPFPQKFLAGSLRAGGRGDLADRLSQSFVVDCSRIRLRLGWRPPLPTREALAAR
ncbi:NAD-dependent epimerase/dehydratase family protein [Aureimonas populi]|uniref:NAD-dependent epimerase/dehydratase family protein n=1 Tax=Aureimonas populi TaxID=1701758 RepID=A0ABW5CLJ7_9HYPH|nr:NAD-dependent epimerase/dehydratase family protein [Aureimonas populi]